jgi:hypothetical protein
MFPRSFRAGMTTVHVGSAILGATSALLGLAVTNETNPRRLTRGTAESRLFSGRVSHAGPTGSGVR